MCKTTVRFSPQIAADFVQLAASFVIQKNDGYLEKNMGCNDAFNDREEYEGGPSERVWKIS